MRNIPNEGIKLMMEAKYRDQIIRIFIIEIKLKKISKVQDCWHHLPELKPLHCSTKTPGIYKIAIFIQVNKAKQQQKKIAKSTNLLELSPSCENQIA